MPNDVDLTGGSWRTSYRGGMDPSIKRLGLIAAGIAGLAVIGLGGWSVMSHRTHVVPVIEADSRPVRVKPDNPGGMQIAGAEEQIMGGAGNGQADAMAPPAEAPAPQALKAQIKAAQLPPSPAPPVAAVVSSPPAAAPVIEARPVRPAAPVATAPVATAPVATASVATAPVHPVASGLQVQLAALESEQAAMAEWQRLSKRLPDLLGGHQPAVQKTERDGRTLYRLRTSGFADIAAATAFCNQLRSKGGNCAIATF